MYITELKILLDMVNEEIGTLVSRDAFGTIRVPKDQQERYNKLIERKKRIRRLMFDCLDRNK